LFLSAHNFSSYCLFTAVVFVETQSLLAGH